MSEFADQGTAAHTVLEACIISIYAFGIPVRARDYVGKSIEVTDGPHGRLSPSAAKRWMQCPAAPTMEAKYPEQTQGPREIVFDEDYADAVQETLDAVDRLRNEMLEKYGPTVVRPEHRVTLRDFVGSEDCDGTLDIALVANDHVKIIDFKAGAGVPVSVRDPQLDLYLLGLCSQYAHDDMSSLPFESAEVVVAQPRCDKVEPRIRSREIPDVRAWATDIVPQLKDAVDRATPVDGELPEFSPSEDACRFCSVGGGAKYANPDELCAAYQAFALRRAGVLPDEKLPEHPGAIYEASEMFARRDVTTLSPHQARQILDAREILQAALQAVEGWVLDQLRRGVADEEITRAYKLVAGRSRRVWAEDEEQTEKMLKRIKVDDPDTGKRRGLGRKDIVEPRLKSAPQIEKLLSGKFAVKKDDARWDAFRALIEKPQGAATIAPIDDPRPAVTVHRTTAEEAFEKDPGEPPPLPPAA